MPIQIVLENDMMLVAVVAGLFSGVGSGLVFRYGATTGGTDIIGRVIEEKFSFKLGQTLLFVDAVVLTASLVYIDLQHMLYTLVASFCLQSSSDNLSKNGGLHSAWHDYYHTKNLKKLRKLFLMALIVGLLI